MPIIATSVVPHTPQLFLKNNGCNEEHQTARHQIQHDLYAAKPDIIVSLSPHMGNSTAFLFQVAPTYVAAAAAVGDLSHTVNFTSHPPLLFRIKEALEPSYRLSLIQDSLLEPGTALPLFNLFDGLPHLPLLIPLGTSTESGPIHFDFGRSLAEILHNTTQRIACIISADLSHRHTSDAPNGFSERALPFDTMVIKLLNQQQPRELLHIDEEHLEEVAECGIRPLLVLAGILENTGLKGNVLHHGVTAGVGHMLAYYTAH